MVDAGVTEQQEPPIEAAQRVALIAISTVRMALDVAESIVADRERFSRLTDTGRTAAEGLFGDLARLAGFGRAPDAPSPPPAAPAPPATARAAQPRRPAATAKKAAPAKKAAIRGAKKASPARRPAAKAAKPARKPVTGARVAATPTVAKRPR